MNIQELKNKFKKINPLKLIWGIWLTLALITTSSLTFLDVAIHAPELPLKLQDGAQVKWEVWRPVATQSTQFEMGYRRASNGDLRLNLLGDVEKGVIGEPVLMRISVNGKSCDFMQDDVTSWNNWVFRPLKPVQAACKLPEQSGWNEWTAQVLQTSPKLVGESTRLGMISPAGTMRNRANNSYGSMAEWLFWGELVWLPFFLFMSIPLILDGINRLAKRFDWERKLRQQWQKLIWNLRHKW